MYLYILVYTISFDLIIYKQVVNKVGYLTAIISRYRIVTNYSTTPSNKSRQTKQYNNNNNNNSQYTVYSGTI